MQIKACFGLQVLKCISRYICDFNVFLHLWHSNTWFLLATSRWHFGKWISNRDLITLSQTGQRVPLPIGLQLGSSLDVIVLNSSTLVLVLMSRLFLLADWIQTLRCCRKGSFGTFVSHWTHIVLSLSELATRGEVVDETGSCMASESDAGYCLSLERLDFRLRLSI